MKQTGFSIAPGSFSSIRGAGTGQAGVVDYKFTDAGKDLRDCE
jgi:hypothetical protein